MRCPLLEDRWEGTGLAIRHTESIKDRIEEARRTLVIATHRFEKTQEQMNTLSHGARQDRHDGNLLPADQRRCARQSEAGVQGS